VARRGEPRRRARALGTHADFRRRGLARAVSAFALRRLQEAGAVLAVVYARGDAAYPTPKLLYESLGFRTHARTITFRRNVTA